MDSIIATWEENAEEWIKTISEESIASRKFTNKAIIDSILETDAEKIIDIGCGEGWLTHTLENRDKNVVGIDGIETLLTHARNKSDAPFYRMTFKEIGAGETIPQNPFELAVFNFCLYQKEGLVNLLIQTQKALVKTGTILIQTLHPYFLIEEQLPYKSQWMKDSWKGLKGDFKNGHAWYARTFEDWIAELKQIPNTIIAFKEVNNDLGKPISLIITLKKIA